MFVSVIPRCPIVALLGKNVAVIAQKRLTVHGRMVRRFCVWNDRIHAAELLQVHVEQCR